MNSAFNQQGLWRRARALWIAIAIALSVGGFAAASSAAAPAPATGSSSPIAVATAFLPNATSTARVTRKVKTWFCDVSPPKRLTTVTRKAGAKQVYLNQKPSAGFKNFWVKFASGSSKKAVKASFVC